MKNVKNNKKEGIFTVHTANGKTRVYKTLTGANKYAAKKLCKVMVPHIVTANTYFWTSGGSASKRRNNEDRRNAEIRSFSEVFNRIPTIQVSGDYRETCGNVYKSMAYEVLKNGEWKSTNLTGLIGECARWGLELSK